MKCKCGTEYKMVLMPYDEYEALYPYCDLGLTNPNCTWCKIRKEILGVNPQ